MRYFLFISLLLCCGCNSWQDRSKSSGERSTGKQHSDVKRDVGASYPSPSKTDLTLTASGNSTIRVDLPNAEQKMVKFTDKTQDQSSSESTFSYDEVIESMSLGGWVAIILSLCMLGGVAYILMQKTIIGRAAQHAAASAAKLTQTYIDELNEKISHADPSGAEWKIFNEMKNRKQKELDAIRIDRMK